MSDTAKSDTANDAKVKCISNRQGRLDLLLKSACEMGAKKLESKTGLVGLTNALMPIAEEEIKKHVGSVAGRNVIPKEFRELAGLVEKYVIQH